jgi:hypothetical protein
VASDVVLTRASFSGGRKEKASKEEWRPLKEEEKSKSYRFNVFSCFSPKQYEYL